MGLFVCKGSEFHQRRRSNLNRSNAGIPPSHRSPLMSLYRETPSGAAQKVDMKVETLAPMALTNFHPVAAPSPSNRG